MSQTPQTPHPPRHSQHQQQPQPLRVDPVNEGAHPPEADVRLFVTLIRFDVAYHGLFKCNLRRIADYPHLSAFTARVLGLPGVRETVSIDHIKRGYYSMKALNPTGIVPLGPELPAELAG